MQFDANCIDCLVHGHFRLSQAKADGQKAYAYLRDVMQILLDAPEGVAAPWLSGAFTEAYAKYWPGEDAYGELKRWSNDLVLALLPQIRPMIEQAADPLALSLQFARTGNFLDFGILTPEVAQQALWDAIEKTPEDILDPNVYAAFRRDLETASSLLILGDNAGEIAFDTLLVEQVHRVWPDLSVTYCVRGRNTLNDATREDAAYVGMDRLAGIIDNGSAISGTEIAYAGPDLQEALEKADVILAKGSGNFECMAGCGLNVYYIFMCKCQRISRMLQVENMTGQFLRERTLPEMDPMCCLVPESKDQWS